MEKANNPHGYGPIDPQKFVPFPKNPTIVKFFIQLGRVEELGSGVLNISRYLKAYSATGKPEFIEGEVFKVRIPLPDFGNKKIITDQQDNVLITIVAALSEGLNGGINEGNGGVNDGVKNEVAKLVAMIQNKEGINAEQISGSIDKPKRTVERYLKIARTAHLIEFIGAPKTGGYYLTEKMKAILK